MSTDGMTPGPDEPVAELLGSASDEVGAGERLRTSVARSGALPWLGRHRAVVGGVTALVLVGAGITAYVVTRPPPADPVVAVTIQPFSTGGTDLDGQGRARTVQSYQVSTVVPGDVVVPVGVVGPGLTAPTSTIPPVHPGLPGLGDLGATVDCTDDQWWGAHEADYRIRVVRTDAHGRDTTYDAPLGGASSGLGGTGWAAGIQMICLFDFVRTLPAASAAGSAIDRHQVEGEVNVTNPTTHRVTLAVAEYDDGRVRLHQGASVEVAAGGTARLSFNATAADCASGLPTVPLATDVQGGPSADHGLPVSIDDPLTASEDSPLLSWLTLDDASVEAVDAALADLCPPAAP